MTSPLILLRLGRIGIASLALSLSVKAILFPFSLRYVSTLSSLCVHDKFCVSTDCLIFILTSKR